MTNHEAVTQLFGSKLARKIKAGRQREGKMVKTISIDFQIQAGARTCGKKCPLLAIYNHNTNEAYCLLCITRTKLIPTKNRRFWRSDACLGVELATTLRYRVEVE